jgi:hypothetical protein
MILKLLPKNHCKNDSHIFYTIPLKNLLIIPTNTLLGLSHVNKSTNFTACPQGLPALPQYDA